MVVNTLMKAIEKLTTALRVIENDHHYIHEGKFFMYNELIVGLAASGTKVIAFTTPNGTYDIHWRPTIVSSSGDKVYLELIELCTLSAAGTDKTGSIFNMNRKSSNTSSMQTFATGATIDSVGTVIKTNYIGGGTSVGGQVSGGSIGVQNEIVLKQNTLYCERVTNGSANPNNIHIQMQWYQEDEYTFT